MKHPLAKALLLFGLIGSTTAQTAPISGQGTWESTLQGRDLDGDLSTFEAYYDTTLDITWLADANYAGTKMDWATANAWAAGLDPYGSGITGWRLPTMVDTGASGCDYAYTGTDCGYNVQTGSAATTVYSEMASLFYDTLGNLAYYDTSGTALQLGWGLTNTGPFSNLQFYFYWSGLELALATSGAWNFLFSNGNQSYNPKTHSFYALAVRPGDVSAVPVPAAIWLFGSGFLGLVSVAWKKK